MRWSRSLDGDALQEIKKVASDINDLLHQLGRDAQAKSKVIKEGMQLLDGWVRDMEKDMRGEFTHFLGQSVGNAVATVFDTYVNIEEGIFKGGVGLVQTIDQLDPTRFLYDPQGAASTWGGLGETVVKANPLYALADPGDALNNDLGLVKGLVHAEDWRGDRPGLGLGENIFDVATLFVPGAGEAGAGAEGAAAGTRAAAEDAVGEVGRAGRVAGELGEAAGAGGALADIGKAGDGLTKDFENLGGELPKSDPPISGGPVGLAGSEAVRRAGRANSPGGFRNVGQDADRSAGRRTRVARVIRGQRSIRRSIRPAGRSARVGASGAARHAGQSA